MLDAKEVRSAMTANALVVASHLLPGGKQDGHEWRCGDVGGGSGQSLAVRVSGERVGVWSDFATDDSGDLLDLWQAVKGCDFKDALQEAAAFIGVTDVSRHKPAEKQPIKREQVLPLPPAGEDGVNRFTYTDIDKAPVIYVMRLMQESGKKSFRQWGRSGDGTGWVANLSYTPKPRPLYRLRSVLNAEVICIHEGEKAVVAACKGGLPYCHTTTIGGAGNARSSDFSPLAGKRVVIIPDNDAAGENHADIVAGLAEKAGAAAVAVMHLPELPAKGDVVEWLAAGGDADQWHSLVGEAMRMSNPSPQPLPDMLRPVMPFDVDMLPWSFKKLVIDVSERMQCPPDFPAVVLLVAAGSLIGRRCAVYPKQLDDWQVTPNLWGALIGRPSLMKSPSMQAALSPLESLIKREVNAFHAATDTMDTEEMVHAAKLKVWKAELARTLKAGGDVSAIEKPGKPEVKTERRFKTNEGSVECLISLLNKNPDGMLFREPDVEKPEKKGGNAINIRIFNRLLDFAWAI